MCILSHCALPFLSASRPRSACVRHWAHTCKPSVRDRQKRAVTWWAQLITLTADEADLNLSGRKSFPWTVLRPSRLLDEPVGTVDLSRQKTIAVGIPRESVALTLLKIAELAKGTAGADGSMWDLTKGQGEIASEVQEAARRRRTDWVG